MYVYYFKFIHLFFLHLVHILTPSSVFTLAIRIKRKPIQSIIQRGVGTVLDVHLVACVRFWFLLM